MCTPMADSVRMYGRNLHNIINKYPPIKKNFKGRRGKKRREREETDTDKHIILIYQCILIQFYLQVLLMHDYLGILKPQQT